MPFKSILCAYSGDPARGSGLRHALKLAQHHGAHLTGVHRHGVSPLRNQYGAQLPASLRAELDKVDAAHLAEVAASFNATIEAAGLSQQAEFVELDPVEDGPLAVFAHAFDILVTGVHSDATNEALLAAHPDMLALRSGRPVLVVPNGYEADGLADRAIVAWDGKRSAARALGDAMDVLAEKTHVTLLSVGAPPRGTERMVRNMERHGVNVDAVSVPRDGRIARTLLAHADAEGAKLIVMGAFEHSKFNHDLFGGVTTDVIADTNVPVLMAH
ncbi:MAG: universal stress protein [Pseudomonadota bacterium]